jgi:16S rRNA G966 N2-methylase RsmD
MNNIEYPYYNLYYKFNKKQFLKLARNYKPIVFNKIPQELKKFQIHKFNETYLIIKENYLKTIDINNITDYFSEKIRIQCKFGNFIEPIKYWNENKKNIIQEAKLLNKSKVKLDNNHSDYYKEIIFNMREIIYKNTKLCSNFRITMATTILKHFSVKRWLDISAGWGDRLISAIIHKVDKYTACDPNLDLHPCYQNIMESFLSKTDMKKYKIYKNGFLEAPIPENEKYDIVFTSPPFFTLEIYSKFPENSIMKYSSELDWINHFFIPSLKKAYKHLEKGGHIVLYMGGSDTIMKAMHRLDSMMKYKGVIYFYEKAPRGIYVWQK